MPKFATKAADNMFCQARYEAAKFNERLSSREGAAEELGVDRTRLARIELGSVTPYPEEVLLMADIYRAPELKGNYCREMCPLGKGMPKIENQDIDTAHGGQPGDQTGKEFLIRSYRNYPWNCILRYAGDQTVTSDAEKKQNTVAYVARFTKDCKCYSAAGKTQAKMFPVIKKNAVVDVMKYTETVNGKKWYFIRIPHPTEGFVREFVPAGYFKKLI